MKLTCKAILLSLLFPAFLNAQEVGLLRLKPERPEKEGTVAVWGGVEQGWFRPTYEGTLQWSAGARASGVRHGEKTSWTGSVSLEQKTGYGMLSSMLLEPGYFPVDLLEFTPGTKSREIGRLEGGFVTDLGYECAIGLKASLQAGYVGKRTDLRHSAFGMGLRLEPTITYVMDDDMGLAAAYVFRLKTERVQMHGDSENTAFLDKGLRYGTYVNGAGAFPIQEMSHGFAGRFYSEEVSAGLEWLWKRGQAGATGVGSFRFPGSSVSVFYEQAFQAEKADHVIRLSYGRDRDQLRESVSDSGIAAVSDRLGRCAEINTRPGSFMAPSVAWGLPWKATDRWIAPCPLCGTRSSGISARPRFSPPSPLAPSSWILRLSPAAVFGATADAAGTRRRTCLIGGRKTGSG